MTPFFYFLQIDDYSNKVANSFLAAGYKRGDAVALYMDNRPEYVAIWLGLAKIGVVPALVNHNQKKQAFEHAVKVADSKAIIFGAEFVNGKNQLLQFFRETT